MSARRGGLGRNLSALLGHGSAHMFAEVNANTLPAIKTLILDVKCLKPGKYQPRRTINDSTLQELADSIKHQGLLQPLVVRAIDKDHYEIIAGERRWRACQLAGLTTVAVIVRQVDDETAMALALIENLQRDELNPIDQARALARLINEFDLTHQYVANLLSKSRTAISNYLRLLALSDEVMSFLEQGNLNIGHARALLTLDNSQQVNAAQLIIAKDLSVRETEQLVKRLKNEKAITTIHTDPKTNKINSTIKSTINQLEDWLNTKINIKSGKLGSGTLIIHYQSNQDLDKIIKKMTS